VFCFVTFEIREAATGIPAASLSAVHVVVVHVPKLMLNFN